MLDMNTQPGCGRDYMSTTRLTCLVTEMEDVKIMIMMHRKLPCNVVNILFGPVL